MPVFEQLKKKEVSEDEWMYQLEEGAKSDPWADWNRLVSGLAGAEPVHGPVAE
eukprot:gene7095-43909_t